MGYGIDSLLNVATGGVSGQIDSGTNLADTSLGTNTNQAYNELLDAGGMGSIEAGLENYFMADTKAAREQQAAAGRAKDAVMGGYGQAMGGAQDLADIGSQDFNQYAGNVRSGAYGTDPSQFQTGQYQAGQFGQGAPQFQQYSMGQAPQFQSFQRGADPTFQRADAGNFDFNYQSSPGYEFAREEGLRGIEGRASAQGRRNTGGTQKEMAEYASNLAAQDFGNQYNRARGQFEADRGFGERQTGLENQFARNQYQFGTGVDVGQQNLANQFGQQGFQFGTNVGIGQSNLANQADINNFWNQQRMQQGESQFGFGANQGANLQNYNMQNQQQQQQAGMMGGLAQTGMQNMVNLQDMQINQGTALANAELGLGNARANRQLAPASTANQMINQGTQLAGAIYGGQ